MASFAGQVRAQEHRIRLALGDYDDDESADDTTVPDRRQGPRR
jgi:hypothetical protein